jgi:hypothetical protein
MRHQTPATPLTDEQRLTQLKLRIWGHVAKQLIRDPKAPHHCPESKIESNKGRITKALRDLGGLVSFKERIQEKQYSRSEINYQVNEFDAQSATLATVPVFLTTWKEYHDEVFQNFGFKCQEEFDSIGYRGIDGLKNSEAIYVYWHQDEYEIIRGTDKHATCLFPKALKETRTKAMLRGIVEQHHQDDYTTKLENYLGLPALSLKRDDSDHITVRSFSARAADFRPDMIKEFQREYETHRLYHEALLYNLNKLETMIQEKGGYDSVTREMRKASMTDLLINAPLALGYEEDRDLGNFDQRQEVVKRYMDKYLNTYLLRNAQMFDYDILFGEDESVTYLSRNSYANVPEERIAERQYTPDPVQQAVITAYLEERKQCSQKNISVLSAVTC